MLALGWLGVATIGLNTLRLGGLAISDGIFFLLAGVLVVKLLVGDDSGLAPPHSRKASHVVLFGTVMLLTAGALSSFVAWNPQESLSIIVRLAYLTLVWFWMLRTIIPTRRALNVVFSGWRFGVLAMAVVAILAQVGVLSVGIENSEDRQTAFYGHPNDLAGYLLTGLPILLMSLPAHPEHSHRRRTLVRLATVGLVVYAITTTGSMTALASAGAAVVATLTIAALVPAAGEGARGRRLHPLSVMAGAVLAVIGLAMLVNSDLPVFERLDRLESGDPYVSGSADHRVEMNAAVVNRFDRWLVVGIGMDDDSLQAANLGFAVVRGGVHNMYLKVLLEAGLAAVIGVLIIQLATFRCAFRLVVNTRDTALHPAAVALAGSAVAGCVFALFTPMLFQRYFWLPIGLVWCLWGLRREELRRESAAAVAAARAVAPRRPADPPPAPAGGGPNGRG